MDRQPEKRSLELADTELGYLLYENSGPTVLMLHATGFSPWLWHPVSRALADKYRIIAPYFCDHREADPESGGMSWLQLAGDLVGLCNSLNIESPCIVGHSMGGAVPTIAAGVLGLKPRKMLLIEPIFLPEELYSIPMRVEHHPLAGKSIRRRNFWEDREEARDYLRSKPLFRLWNEEVLDLYIRFGIIPMNGGGFVLACPPRQEAALFMGSMAYNPWTVMRKVDCPVLVLEGEKTENRGIIDFSKAARTFPMGSYRLVEGAGHLIPMEKPELTASIIRQFLNEEP